MKRFIAIFAIMLVTLFALSGCGGGGDTEPDQAIKDIVDNIGDSGGDPTDPTDPTVDLTGATIALLPASISDVVGETTLTALLKDSDNAPLAGQTVNFSFTGSNNATLSATAVVTATDGTAQVTVTNLVNSAAAVTVKATLQALTSVTDSAVVNFIVDTGEPTAPTDPTLDLTGATISLLPSTVSDVIGETTLTALLKDGDNAPLGSQIVEFSFTGANNATLSATAVVTAADGTAQVTVTNLVNSAAAVGVQATLKAEPTVTDTSTVNFIVDTGEPTDPTDPTDPTIDLTGANLSLLPGTVSAVEEATLTVLLKDGNFAPLAGQTIDFGFTAANNATLSPASATTGEDGTATVTVRNLTNSAEDVTVKATLRAENTITGTATVNFTVDTTDPSEVRGAYLALQPGSLTAVGSATLTAVLKDANFAPVAGELVTFRFDQNYDSATLSPAQATTGEDGTVQVTIRDLDSVDHGVTIIAESGTALTASSAVDFKAAFGSDKFLTATVADSVLGATSATTLTATVRDANGFPVPGVTVSFSETGAAGLSAATADTDASGEATVTVTGGGAETSLVAIQAGTAALEVPVYFGSSLSLSPATASGTADGSSAVALAARLTAANGQPIVGETVTFQIITTGASAQLDTIQGATDAQGRVTVSVTDIKAETVEVEASAGALAAATSDVTFEPGPPAAITLAAATGTALSLGGTDTLTATVTDVNGNPVSANTEVTFTATPVGSVTASALTGADIDGNPTGIATAEFNAGSVAGISTVTASVGALQKSLTLQINPADAGTIELDSIEPADASIHVQGTVGDQSATIRFRVLDGFGNEVSDGTVVNFALPVFDNGTGDKLFGLGGGEVISAGGAFGTTATGTTVNSIATVNVRSGIIAGTLDVIASVDVDGTAVSTLARVTIVGGQPDSRHISLAAEYLNIAGGVTFGLQDTITAYLGDRFGNVPLDGTPVSFYSECGTIGSSQGFTATTTLGVATATLQASAPTVPQLAGTGWADADSDGIPNDALITASDADGSGIIVPREGVVPNVGLCGILAVTPGDEFYEDNNGNGIYDAATDNCTGDQGEPFIDGNDNGSYDVGEFYVDINHDNSYTPADGVCQQSTMIWADMNVLVSDDRAPLNVRAIDWNGASYDTSAPDGFRIRIGESQSFVVDFADIWGNALVAGSSLTVSTDAGTIGGIESHVQADTTGSGTTFSFSLFSETKEDAEPTLAKITVTATPPEGGGQGDNGAGVTRTITGTINLPQDSTSVVGAVAVAVGPDTVTVGETATVRATVTDTGGQVMEGVTVLFNSPGGSFEDATGATTSSAETDASGNATLFFRAGGKAGETEVIVSADAASAKATVTLLPDAAGQVQLSAAPSRLNPGDPSAVTVVVTDADGNPIEGETVNFALTTNNTSASLDSPSVVTDAEGKGAVNYTAGSDMSAQSLLDTITATLASDATITTTADVTVVTEGLKVAAVTVAAAPATLAADDGTSSSSITALVTDEEGLPLKGILVNFATSLGRFDPALATVVTDSAVTDGSGTASVTLYSGQAAGTATVTATANAVSGSGEVVISAGAADTIVLTPATATVKPTGTVSVSAAVTDAFGNPVSGQSVAFSVDINTSGDASVDSSAVTDADGLASVTYTAGRGTGVDLVLADAGTAAGLANYTVSTAGIVANSISLALSPTSLPADGAAVSLLTATVRDLSGQPAPGMAVTFGDTNGLGTLLDLTTGAALAGTVLTDANGIAQAAYQAGALTGTEVVTTAVGALTTSKTLTLRQEASSLALMADDSTIAADGAATTTLTALVFDDNLAPVAGITVNFTTTRGSLSAASDVTDETGSASVDLTSADVLGTATVVATAGTLSDSTNVQFVVGDPATLTLSATPATVALGGQTSLLVTVRDAQANPIADAPLFFGFSPDISGNQSGGTYSAVNLTTDSQGQATLNYTAGDTAGTDTLEVTTENGLIDTVAITVDPAAVTVGSLTLTPDADSLLADGTDSTRLVVSVKDTAGNPITGVDIALTTTAGTLGAATITTDALGNAETTLMSEAALGTAYVTAVTGGRTAVTEIAFVAGAPDATNSSISASPSTIPADGTSEATVIVTLLDANNNAVSDGTTVTLATTAGTVTSANPATTTFGRAEFTLVAPTTADTATLTIAEVLATDLSATVDFGTPSTGGEAASVSLAAADSALFVAGVGKLDSTAVTVELKESNGGAIDETFWNNNTARLSFATRPNGGEFLSGTGVFCSDPAFTDQTACEGATETWSERTITTLGWCDDPDFTDQIACTGAGATWTTDSIDVLTADGTAVANLQAGTLPGVVEIQAEALDTDGSPTGITAALPQVSIASGPPHAMVLTHPITNSVENLEGGVYRRVGTAIVTDRYGNSVPDGTVINFGLIDSVIASGDGAGTTTALSTTLFDATGAFTGTIERNSTSRSIQANDRVLLLNAPAEDKARFATSVTDANNLEVQRAFDNDSPVGDYDYVVGASLLGSYISGFDADGNLVTGQGVTRDGLATFKVTYPANSNTIRIGCLGYAGGGPSTYAGDSRFAPDSDSAQVYVVAAASDDSAATVNQGEFCFAPIAGFNLDAAPTELSLGQGDSTSVTLTLEDGGDGILLPFYPLSASWTLERGTVGTCSNPAFITEATCVAPGSCSDGVSADQAACETAGATWTPDNTWSETPSDFDLTVTTPATNSSGNSTSTVTVTGVNIASGDSATITYRAGDGSATVTVTVP